MKKLLLLLLLVPITLLADDDKLFLENKLKAIHLEIGEISAKIAFCREYGTKQKNYFIYGTKAQGLFATASGTIESEACMYLEKKGYESYCDESGKRTMQIMWGEYRKWKGKLTEPSYDINSGCLEFIPQINTNKIYTNANSISQFLKNKGQQTVNSDLELEQLKDLNIVK
jgi:hypothetical protein